MNKHIQFVCMTPAPGVLHILFQHRRDLTFTMHRVQEFYESPHANIKGQYFTYPDFLEAYSDETGELTYFNEWDGFNVPDHCFNQFFELFAGELTPREQNLRDLINQYDAQYVIATSATSHPSTYAHEIAHARWYADPMYKMKAKRALSFIAEEVKQHVFSKLFETGGYSSDPLIVEDELHAYLQTEPNMVEYFELTKFNPSLYEKGVAMLMDLAKSQ